VYFVSNNSTKARKDLLVSFEKLGFEAHEVSACMFFLYTILI